MSGQSVEQHYETVCIIHPDTDEATVKEIISKTSSAIEATNGKDLDVDEWGRKRLAYPIQKKNEGYYVLFTYTASAKTPAEVDRALRFREDIMRYQTVKIDERVKVEVKPAEATPEAAKPEAAKPEAAKPEEAKPEEAKTAATATETPSPAASDTATEAKGGA